jgi:hypothetical protein
MANIVRFPVGGTATYTADSSYSGSFLPANAADGSYSTDWAVVGVAAGHWWQVTWSLPQTLDNVVLRDRSNLTDLFGAGVLSFSDGSTVNYGALPNDGSPLTIPFATKLSTWMRVTTNGGSGLNIGLAEVEASASPSPPPSPGVPVVDPLEGWRILIKGMGGLAGGGVGVPGKTRLTFNATTQIWRRCPSGIIDYYLAPNCSGGTRPADTAPAGGPYWVEPIIVPFDPVHATGGSAWLLKEGPNAGWLVSQWTNSLGYGNITVTTETTATFNRGPGATLATIYRPAAHLAGASLGWNAPGEMHLTLLVDDPNILVIKPKQTHYAIEFYRGGAWVEVFAGLVWDMDATDTEVVFYGIDYLALFGYTWDERFDPKKPKKQAPAGSFYVKKTITEIVTAQLTYAISQPDSLVNFITLGAIDPMNEKIEGIYSTMQNTLDFVLGLLNSHRAGTQKQTRLSVKKLFGVYVVMVEDNPGIDQDAFSISYGDLAQGYRVIPFGTDWASRVNMIGRDRAGSNLLYRAESSAVDQGEWGRIGQAPVMIESVDAADLKRRALQAAIDASRLGRQISVGTKLGSFAPLENYDICDNVPVIINHGAVQTQNWGSDAFGADPPADPSGVDAAYWTILGLTWESYDDGHWVTSPTLYPKGGGLPALMSGVVFVAVGNGNLISTSPDGITWTGRSSAEGAGTTLTAIVYGDGLWATSKQYSMDGINWRINPVNLGGGQHVAVAFGTGSDGRDFYIAAGTFGNMWISEDGITWNWGNVAYYTRYKSDIAYGNKRWIDVNEDGNISTATVGDASFTGLGQPIGAGALIGIGYGKDAAGHGLWIVVGGSGRLGTSYTGTADWVARDAGFGATSINKIMYGKDAAGLGLWVAVGGAGKLATSPDGSTWTQRTSSFGAESLNDIAYANGTWVAVGTNGKVASSTDGITWTQRAGAHGSSTINGVYGLDLGTGDLIAAPTDLQVGNGPPIASDTSSDTYVDRTTGQLYVRNDDTDTWDLSGAPGPRILTVGEMPGSMMREGEPGEDSWVPGPMGPAGRAGIAGPPGLDGEPGEDGSEGPPGPAGVAGAAGAAGPQGDPGAAGPAGIGVPGWDGEDGEASFVPGPQGMQGDAGAQGDSGPQGLIGVQGVPGLDGEDGEDSFVPGPQGTIGATGATGVQGIQGDIGPTGATGQQGPQGFGILSVDGEDGADSFIPGPPGPPGTGGGTGSRTFSFFGG